MNRNTHQDTEDVGASMEINWDTGALGGATLTSVTGWRNWDFENGQDVDYTARTSGIANRTAIMRRSSNSSVRNSGWPAKQIIINWLVGAFYADEQLDSKQQLQYGSQYRNYI